MTSGIMVAELNPLHKTAIRRSQLFGSMKILNFGIGIDDGVLIRGQKVTPCLRDSPSPSLLLSSRISFVFLYNILLNTT